MGVITLTNVDEDVARKLESLPEDHRRLVEAELREAARYLVDRADRARERRRRADRIAAMTPVGVTQTDSVALLREDRDR